MGTAFSFKTGTNTFAVLNGFANWGERPVSDLVKASDGNLYGMAPNGGSYDYGTLFRISTSGTLTVLKNFDGSADGGYPKGSLIQAKDGYLYGMTTAAASGYAGTIFKISPTSGQFSVVKSLAMNTDGGRPSGHLVQATDGNFYGITRAGGVYGYGVIFKLTTDGTYSVLKSVNGTTEGGSCYGSLMQGSDGAFYGMMSSGGSYGYGVIFRYSLTTGYSVLKHLKRDTDAAYPVGDLVQAKDGYLYGLAPSGIAYNGVAFKIKPDGSAFNLIHQFSVPAEGGNPGASLVQGSDGYFYGLVSAVSGYGYGIFKMRNDGYTTSVKKLAATDGSGPVGSLIQLSDGYLYGMTQYGGKNEDGTVFKVSTGGGTFNILAHLNGATVGNAPQDNLAIGKDSAYFGTTFSGGTYNQGTIFKICGGVTTVIKSFNRSTDGGNPSGGLVRGKDGNLYGTTEGGGTNGGGTVFKLTSSGIFSVLRHLTTTTDGGIPKGTLALATGTDSALYGTTYNGGTNGGGTVFRITLKGDFKVLRHFVNATDGDHSDAGLVFKDSVFYGITGNSSRFYKINPNGFFTVIKSLVYGSDGGYPLGNMIVGKDGQLYATLSSGGTYSKGVVLKITTGGTITRLRQFNGTTDGGLPRGSLVQTADSSVYGTTFSGGANNVGVIFKISKTGSFSVVKNFNMAADGGNSLSGLLVAPAVNLAATQQTGLTTNEDVAKAITLAGSGATNLTYSIVTAPKHGKVSTGTGSSRTYTPSANYYGVDSFAFTANVGCLASAPAWIKITVTAVNDAPVLASIGSKTVVLGSTVTFTAAATDPDAGQTKTFSLITPPSGAIINATSGAFSWKPTATGTFTVKIRVTDNGSPVLYDEETITVTVTATASAFITSAANSTRSAHAAETKAASMAKVYPNPVVSNFTVSWEQPVEALALTIVDTKGSVVYASQYKGVGTQLQVSASQLKAGSYVVILKTENTTQSLKLMKQ